MTLIQSIMYGIFAGAFVLVLLKAFGPTLKPMIEKYIKNREEKKKNELIRKKEISGSSSSNTTNTTSSKQCNADNSRGVSGLETNTREQQSSDSKYKSAEQAKQYKSIFE